MAKNKLSNFSIYKPTERSGPEHKWLVAYKDGNRRPVKAVSTDLGITRQYAMELWDRLERKRLGLLTTADEKFLEYAAKPLLPQRDDNGRPIVQKGRPTSSHLGDYTDLLRARRRTAKQVQMVESRVTRLLDLMEAERIDDIEQDGVELAIATLADQDDLATQTCVHYLKALKQFTRWMRKSRRARTDEAEDVQPFNAETDIVHPRRALTDEQIPVLLAAAKDGADHVQGRHVITGAERELLYALDLESGLRANELRSLTPESLTIEGKNHLVIVEARSSKHRRRDKQVVKESVWLRVRDFAAGKPAGKPIWDVPPKVFLMLRQDLDAAGIPYLTDEGYADFHALRHTYCTRVGRDPKTTPKECQELMRHTDIRLTMRYMHAKLHDLSRAVERLPDLAPEPEHEQQRATGTDSAAPEPAPSVQRGCEQLSFPFGPDGSPKGPQGAARKKRQPAPEAESTPAQTGVYGKIGPETGVGLRNRRLQVRLLQGALNPLLIIPINTTPGSTAQMLHSISRGRCRRARRS